MVVNMSVNVSVNVGRRGAWNMSAVEPPLHSHSYYYSSPSPLVSCDTPVFVLLFGPAIGAADGPNNEARTMRFANCALVMFDAIACRRRSP